MMMYRGSFSNDSVEPLIGVIDAGTRTVKFCVFRTEHTKEVARYTVDIATQTPEEGWSEQDPNEILTAIRTCMENVVKSLGHQANHIATLGITNQRETTIVWDKTTGEPLHNAIVWNDIRTDSTVDLILSKVPDNNTNYFKNICGLPISPYFSAFKLKWLINHVPKVKKAVKAKKCLFGTVDTWILWNLTGGVNNGKHFTDVTNASRTFLMNIDLLNWDPQLLHAFNIPTHVLPEIKSSSEIYGYIAKGFPLEGVTISGILGNQQASLVGQRCLKEGQAKNTYRSGCFLLYNTGTTKVSTQGLVTTVAYKFGNLPTVYALEGSVAVAGAAIKWLRDNMGFIQDVQKDTESLAQEVFNTGDVYFVPAFKGLYAPYWRKDARGIICGLTAFSTKQHIIRAALEAVCFQTRDILESMKKDCGIPLSKLHVDGKMTTNNLLMQLQADISGIPVIRAESADITALGTAMAAGAAAGIELWDINAEERELVPSHTFLPTSTASEPKLSEVVIIIPFTNLEKVVATALICLLPAFRALLVLLLCAFIERNARYTKWKMAVERSLGWALPKRTSAMTDERYRLLASIPGSLFFITSFGLIALSEFLVAAQ